MIRIGDTDAKMAILDIRDVIPKVFQFDRWKRGEGIEVTFCEFEICRGFTHGAILDVERMGMGTGWDFRKNTSGGCDLNE